MAIPRLKRIKVASERELLIWLTKNASAQEVMIVARSAKSPEKHLGRALVSEVLHELGWSSRARYTLPGGHVGHVARHA